MPNTTKSPARQMAQDIVDLAHELGADVQVLESHLLQRGWSPKEIRTNGEAARAIAANTLAKTKRAA